MISGEGKNSLNKMQKAQNINVKNLKFKYFKMNVQSLKITIKKKNTQVKENVCYKVTNR